MDDTKLNELLLRAYGAAPEHIQEFIADEGLDEFMLDLQVDKKLRADVAASVSDHILLTLLGVMQPAELATALKTDTGLTETQAVEVLQEVNKSIFIPLKEKTLKKEAPQAAPAQVQQPKPVPPPPAYVPPTPKPAAQKAPVFRPFVPPPATQPVSAPTPPVQPQAPKPVAPTTPAPKPQPVHTTSELPQRPPMRTMMQDAQQAQHPTPPPTPTPRPAPVQTPPAIAQAPVTPPSFTKTPGQPSTPNKEDLANTLKQYGVDPYREPVE